MKIAIIGATGNVGTKLTAEALARGHEVTAISRNPGAAKAGLKTVAGDVNRPAELARILAGHDAVISSVHFLDLEAETLLRGVREARVRRLLVVGGAGSLEVAQGVRLVDTPQFPPQYKAEALAGAKFLDTLRAEREIEWTFLSPSALFLPEGRTGKFRLGQNQLLTNSRGESKVTMADFAIAMLDEVEQPRHVRSRFTVVDAS